MRPLVFVVICDLLIYRDLMYFVARGYSSLTLKELFIYLLFLFFSMTFRDPRYESENAGLIDNSKINKGLNLSIRNFMSNLKKKMPPDTKHEDLKDQQTPGGVRRDSPKSSSRPNAHVEMKLGIFSSVALKGPKARKSLKACNLVHFRFTRMSDTLIQGTVRCGKSQHKELFQLSQPPPVRRFST